MKNRIKLAAFASIFIGLPNALFAQVDIAGAVSSFGESAEVVAFFFIILTLATILNRLFELFVDILKLIYGKSALLQEMWETVWESILEKLKALDPQFNNPDIASKLKEKLRVLLIQAIVFSAGSVIGVWLCSALGLGMLAMLNFIPHTTFWDSVLTGILVASGTEPIHAIFRIIEAKKDKKALEAVKSSLVERNPL